MSDTILQRNTRRGDIRLEKFSPTDYRVQIFAPNAGSWEDIDGQTHPGPATGRKAFFELVRRMTRP